jgi:ATP-dependent RNA helicase RhlE
MTDQIADFIQHYFYNPETVSIAVSGTRLENIDQTCYPVNFYTKQTCSMDLLTDEKNLKKVGLCKVTRRPLQEPCHRN